jgi:uncharacterized SAM-binding protein YcdF (DUF218 family)
MSIRWLLWSLLSPSQLILFSIALGIALLALGRLRSARMFLLVGGSGLLVFGLLPTSIYLANVLETRFPQPTLPDRVDGIVLLAGAERPVASQAYGEPQVGARGSRYVTLLRLAYRYPQARIIYSGGARQEPGKGPLETQAAVAERILGTVGLDRSRVQFDERSRDTCASGQRVRALAQPRSGDVWVVVTSAIHVPRTMACFRAGGWPEIIPQPANYASVLGGWNAGSIRVASNLGLLDEAAHEWLGLLYYRLTGRTRQLFPGPGTLH